MRDQKVKMKYHVKKVLLLSEEFEKLSKIENDNLYKEAQYGAAAKSVLSLIVPQVLSAIKEEKYTFDNLDESIKQVIKEFNDLDKTLESPVWESLQKMIVNVGTGAATGAGLLAPTGVGAAGGAAVGAVGGIIKSLSDFWQVKKLSDEMPKNKENFTKYKNLLNEFNKKYIELKNINNTTDSQASELIVNQYLILLNNFQSESSIISAIIERMKLSTVKLTDMLSQISFPITSDLKDIQDAINRLQPVISETLLLINKFKNDTSKSQESLEQKEDKKSEVVDFENKSNTGSMGNLSWD